MDLLKSSSQAFAELSQATTQRVGDAIANIQNATTELASSSLETIAHLKTSKVLKTSEVLGEAIQQTTEAASTTIDHLKVASAEMVAGGVAKADELKRHSHELVQKTSDDMHRILTELTQEGIQVGAVGLVMTDALKDLPRTIEALVQEMPRLANRLRHQAGLRVGDTPRSDADVLKLFEKIPGTSRLGASETHIRQFLADKHGSHILARSQGGSNGAENILWEVGADNIRRGARAMTSGEQVYIRFYNAVDSVLKNSTTIAQLGITATGTAVLTQAVVTAAAYALDLYRGDITVEEFRDRVVAAAVSAGIATPIFFLILIVVLALLPELTLILSAPIVVAGFNALFGISIAVPLIQSVLRHVKASESDEGAIVQFQSGADG
jgi:hypothetical protein